MLLPHLALTSLSLHFVQVFAMLDRDGSGGISKEEFRNGVSALNVRFDDHHVDALFKMVDADGNGEVTKEELKAGLFPHNANFIKVQGKYDSYNGYATRVRTPLVNIGAAGSGSARSAGKSGKSRRRRTDGGEEGIGRIRRVEERSGRSKRHTYSGDGVSRRTAAASSTTMRTNAGAPMARRSGGGSGGGSGRSRDRDRDSSGALGLRGPETNDGRLRLGDKGQGGSDSVGRGAGGQQMRSTARPRRLPSMESPVPQQLGHAATFSHLPPGVSGGRDAGVKERGQEGKRVPVPRSLPSLGKSASTPGL